MRILVAEDEKDMNKLICSRLKKEGYAVDSVSNGEEAFTYLDTASYDALILDIMMPKMDGMTLLRKIRAMHIDTPVLFLTARDGIDDRVNGLDAGANDYLVKPFSFKELMARIRVLTRKRTITGESSILKVYDLELDIAGHNVCRNGIKIKLSAKEFAVLEYLMINAGIVVTRDKIQEHVWSYDYEGASNMIDVYIRYLRKKIDEPFEKKLIHTIRGTGYLISEE